MGNFFSTSSSTSQPVTNASSNMAAEIPATHWKCRESRTYTRDDSVVRFVVPDTMVKWSILFDSYKPVDHTAQSVLKKPIWADPDFRKEKNIPPPKWNDLDGKVDRRSHMGKYDIDKETNVPRNPVGRTGVCGRGCLGRWGPNHAADPIVTRWKRERGDGEMQKHPKSSRPILQFIAIQRRDNGEWAIPGGMVDPGELVTETLHREFSEEALNTLELSQDERRKMEERVAKLFQKGKEVYRGYVDDPRNTDNAWMETVAYNFHDEKGDSLGKFKLNAGDDAVGVKWKDIDSKLKLYASHLDFIKKVAENHAAHWSEPTTN